MNLVLARLFLEMRCPTWMCPSFDAPNDRPTQTGFGLIVRRSSGLADSTAGTHCLKYSVFSRPHDRLHLLTSVQPWWRNILAWAAVLKSASGVISCSLRVRENIFELIIRDRVNIFVCKPFWWCDYEGSRLLVLCTSTVFVHDYTSVLKSGSGNFLFRIALAMQFVIALLSF